MAADRGESDPAAGSGWNSVPAALRIGGVAVLFVVAVVAARARAAGYAPHMAPPPGGLVLGLIRMVGIGILTTGLILLIWGRRTQLKKLAGGKPTNKKLTEEQRKRTIVAVLFGVILSLIYQIVQQWMGPSKPQKQADQQPNMPPDQHGLINFGKAGHHPAQAGIGTYVSVAVVVVAVVILLAILLRRQDVLLEDADEDDEAEAEAVDVAMAAGQAAVRDQTILDTRQAIVACFAAMERALAGVGGEVAPRAADTPEEVLRRGISGARLPQAPARTLLELFREARFSVHPMDQADRESADRALGVLRESLAAGSRAGQAR